jgi:hypothetical protein
MVGSHWQPSTDVRNYMMHATCQLPTATSNVKVILLGLGAQVLSNVKDQLLGVKLTQDIMCCQQTCTTGIAHNNAHLCYGNHNRWCW